MFLPFSKYAGLGESEIFVRCLGKSSHILKITDISSMGLIQRRGSSLELKIPSTQIVAKTTIRYFFGLRVTVESYFHGTSLEPEKVSLLSVRTRNSVSLNC